MAWWVKVMDQIKSAGIDKYPSQRRSKNGEIIFTSLWCGDHLRIVRFHGLPGFQGAKRNVTSDNIVIDIVSAPPESKRDT